MIMSILKKFKKSTFGQYMISEYHCLASYWYPRLVSDKKAVIRYYKKKSGGKMLNLENPRTFSEKLQWYKLNAKNPLMQICADKVAVRDYLTDLGCAELLNDVHGIYGSVKDIDWDVLPERFVIKAAHGSGQNIIVTDKKKLTIRNTKRMLNSWLHQPVCRSDQATSPSRIAIWPSSCRLLLPSHQRRRPSWRLAP